MNAIGTKVHGNCYCYLTIACRSISNVRGFTRETLIAVTTTIESREWIRRRNARKKLPPEHPRASTTDDVECFFSLTRNMIGNHFTVKDVQFGWRKICNEFANGWTRNFRFIITCPNMSAFLREKDPTSTSSKTPRVIPAISEYE